MDPIYALQPADESHRLQALRPYELVTAIPDPLFNELVRLTASLFAVPIAVIALVEASTVQFRLNVGLPANTRQEPRDESLCSIAILHAGTTVYENLPQNPCELAEPGLVERLNLQFYAGHPLHTASGAAIGVLCVMDHQPRRFEEADRLLLERLTTLVMQLLDARLQTAKQADLNAALWPRLYDRTEDSINRLGTLAALAQWEDSPNTPGAIAYRQSTREEIIRVLDELHAQITDLLAAQHLSY